MAGALTSSSEDGTLILTLNNPDSKNTLNAEICAAGIEALNAAENNTEIRSVVITGAGGVFCTGTDLRRLQAGRRESLDEQARSVDVLHSWIDSLHTYPKPVIAAVEGAAAGGALGEALNMAARLNGLAPNALASIKDLINDAPAHTLSQHLDSEHNHFVRNLQHANSGEGMDAFLQKRPPRYR